MIPQVLTGNSVTAYVHFTDNTEITATLKGEWKAGTTRTLKLSETRSSWNYTITATNPSAAAFNATTTDNYGITSYRTAPDGTQQAVAWKVVGYDANGDGTFTMAEKPAWLTSLSKTDGNGGTAADQGTATLTKNITDLLAKRNKELKDATALGSASAPYDLSTKGGSVSRSTANSYVISAPGYYRIPLVYGNAIENGNDNPSSYRTSNTGTYILSNFQDHAGNPITDPWIEKTNSGANNGVDGAEIVWADAANLVYSPAIKHDANNDAFLEFEVKASDIQSGNAVVAVKKGGTTVWSWHLWFAPKDALDKIKVTNHQNVNYYFTKEALGWKPTLWRGSTIARTVKVKVEQTVANNGTKAYTVINITQNPGSQKKGATTLYQFGRKDAFPGADIKQGSITENAGNNMSIQNGIQNPGSFYTLGDSWSKTPPAGYSYNNLWSADNTVTGGVNVGNDNPIVKTIYDPCPVGFKMPANNAFTGFTADGQNLSTLNVDGTDNGWTFYINSGHIFWTNGSKTATIYVPASGYRDRHDGSLNNVDNGGCYWSAVPSSQGQSCSLNFYWKDVYPLSHNPRCLGFAALPVSE